MSFRDVSICIETRNRGAYSDTLSATYLAAAPIAPSFTRVCPVMMEVLCVMFDFELLGLKL